MADKSYKYFRVASMPVRVTYQNVEGRDISIGSVCPNSETKQLERCDYHSDVDEGTEVTEITREDFEADVNSIFETGKLPPS